jgi:hypothetical protein
MIKVSSRFLMVLMLAVLATTGVLTTSAFAAGPLGRVLRHVESTLPGFERRFFNGVENRGLQPGSSLEPCGFGCRGQGFLDAPPIRQPRYVEPLW